MADYLYHKTNLTQTKRITQNEFQVFSHFSHLVDFVPADILLTIFSFGMFSLPQNVCLF